MPKELSFRIVTSIALILSWCSAHGECPNLQGNYLCSSAEGTLEIQIRQHSEANGVFTYSLETGNVLLSFKSDEIGVSAPQLTGVKSSGVYSAKCLDSKLVVNGLGNIESGSNTLFFQITDTYYKNSDGSISIDTVGSYASVGSHNQSQFFKMPCKQK